MIQLHNVFLSYQKEVSALSNINLKVAKGEFVFLTAFRCGQINSAQAVLWRTEAGSRAGFNRRAKHHQTSLITDSVLTS
jgi:ABC-type ATPase involved in cell division